MTLPGTKKCVNKLRIKVSTNVSENLQENTISYATLKSPIIFIWSNQCAVSFDIHVPYFFLKLIYKKNEVCYIFVLI